jgi:type II secretory pathway predicted ATPase ExeA
MYYDNFGLKQPPFRITPDTSLFFPGGERGAVLDALIFAVTNGEGIVKVVGEVGSGKTMLCRMLQKELPASVEIVYLANPSLSPENILQAIAFELKLPLEANSSKLLVMHKIQEYLINKHAQNQQVVVFVEEAQGMPLATLEEIRLLSNLETNQNKLLQIILFGQPELDQNISRREIRQLKERITYSFQLNPFRIGDTKEYINSRLRACGHRAGDLFSDSAFKAIARYSNGLVRRINILADKAMLAAYAGNTNRITAKHVRQAARDSEFITHRWRYWLPSSVLMVILFGALGYWSLHEKSIIDGFAELPQAQQGPVAVHPPAAPLAGAVTTEPEGQGIKTTPGKPVPAANVASIVAPTAAANIDQGGEKTGKNVTSQLPDALVATATGKADVPDASGDTGQEDAVSSTPVPSELPQTPAAQGGKDSLEAQLIGLNGVFRMQDMGDARLTDQEEALLRRQLEKLPPEEAVSLQATGGKNECKLCWSIIYRPLFRSGNL